MKDIVCTNKQITTPDVRFTYDPVYGRLATIGGGRDDDVRVSRGDRAAGARGDAPGERRRRVRHLVSWERSACRIVLPKRPGGTARSKSRCSQSQPAAEPAISTSGWQTMMRMGFLGLGGTALMGLALILSTRSEARVLIPTPYWEIGVVTVLLVKLYRGPADERLGAIALCAGLLLVSPAVTFQIQPFVHVTILVALGTYLLYSDLRMWRSTSHRQEAKGLKSVVVALILLIVLAAVVYFVLPYAFD